MSSIEPQNYEAQEAPKDGTSGKYVEDHRLKSAGTGRLSSLVPSSITPSLGRVAGAAAQVSQEAARYTFDHAKRYSMKKQWKNRAGRAPPGQDDPSACMDWSGAGDRFSSLSCYEHQLIGHVPGDDASGSKAANTRHSKHDRNYAGDLSTIATLEQVDEWIESPIYDDDSNAIGGLGALDDSDLEGVADAQDEPSPTEDRRDSLESFKSPESPPEMVPGYPTEEFGTFSAAEKQSSSSVDTASSASANLKPMFRKSAGLVSTLVKKSKAAAIAVRNERTGGKGVSGAEDATGNGGVEDHTASIDTANPKSISPERLGQLKREASAGNRRAQSQLRGLFGPPRSAMKGTCEACGEPFSMSRYRHHCKRCGGSFCIKHAGQAHPMPRMGLPRPQRVCSPCEHILETEDWRELVDWRLERIDAHLEGRLIEYFDDHVDTKTDKAWRVMDGAIYVGKVAPIGSTLKVSLRVMDAFRKYGVTGLSALVLRKEFVEAVDAIRSICGVDKNAAKNVHEISAAMFYMMAERRAQRGNHPNGEHEAHRAFPSLSNEELSFFRRVAPVGLVFPNLPTLELQVLCNITEWSLIFHREESSLHRLSFALVASRATATAVLAIRGTKSIEDVVTDVQTQQVPFPPRRKNAAPQGEHCSGGSERAAAGVGVSSASSGMARAAEWLYREVLHSLVKLRRAGQKILIMGHSLGAGVAVLLGQLVREAIPDVRVVAFGTPAIASLELSKRCEDICTSIILHDDIVPRITPRAIRNMMDEAKCTKEFWAKHLQDDMDAVVDRAKGLWAPRMRGTPSMSSSDVSTDSAFGDARDPGVKTAEVINGGYSGTHKDPELVKGPPGTPTQPTTRVPPPLPPRRRDAGATDAALVGNGVPSEGSSFGSKDDASEGVDTREPGSGSFGGGGDAIDLLPDLFVPGRIVHIYSQRGVYRASDVPRDHRCLREFPVYGNILSDHHTRSYYGALQEVVAVRKAEARGAVVPEWVPFSAYNECQLCKVDFFWASTLRSEAQRSRDKHNCRMCGILVCHACSDHKEPLPQYGVMDPSRVCSRCFYGTEDLRLP